MRHSIISFFAVTIAASGFLLGAMPTMAQTVEGPEVKWNASLWGKEREFTQATEAVADYVSEKTGGRFTIAIHYGEALSKSRENLDGIKLGAFDVAMFCAGYHPGKNPAITVLELPFIYGDLDGAQAAAETIYDHPYVKEEMARWNAMLLVSSMMPPQRIFGKGEVPDEIADFDGMRIRALGGMGQALAKLNAVPTSVPAPEVFTAIDRGTINAATSTIGSAFSFGIAEASDWFTGNLKLGASTCPTVVALDSFNELPEQYQKVLMNARATAHAHAKQIWGATENTVKLMELGKQEAIFSEGDIAKIKELGGKPVWSAWIEKHAEMGLPAQELFDAMMEGIAAATN
jgi:TRAP-type C4-dicarboxylate transport system substrate-binding protein